MSENCPILEKLFRKELKRNGERWRNQYKIMSDNERRSVLGNMLVRRIVLEEMEVTEYPEEDDSGIVIDPELKGTQGPLGSDSGGGRRVLRGTKSFT